MVVIISKVLSEEGEYVKHEITVVNNAVVTINAILKLIFETDYILDEFIILFCEMFSIQKVSLVKTNALYDFAEQNNGIYSYKRVTAGPRTLDNLLYVMSLGVTPRWCNRYKGYS